jgi:hypothetical protein
MIGVTGATGHLGQAILEILPDCHPIGRNMPEEPLTGLIHAAAPDYRDEESVVRFHEFNLQLHEYLTRTRLRRVVIVGSWWQHAEGNCQDLLYTQMKDHQQRLFTGTHVLPYSIYGDEPRPGRGFIPQLIEAIRGNIELQGLSDQPRDFIHVTDVARACIIALDSPRGTYIAGTGTSTSPKEIAARYGITAPPLTEYPTAIPAHLARPVPAWQPLVDLYQHINTATG